MDTTKNLVKIEARPDRRYFPVCHRWGNKVKKIHSYKQRTVRDLDILGAKTFVRVTYRIVSCCRCGKVGEDLGLMDPYMRVTRRMANYIIELCKLMSIREVAEHLGLDWKTVKEIHKRYLKERFDQEQIGNPKLLAIDEISLKKRHHYLTVIIDWETGRVLWVGKGKEVLKGSKYILLKNRENL